MSYVDVLRPPDSVDVVVDAGRVSLEASGAGVWRRDDVEVTTRAAPSGVPIQLAAPRTPVKRVHLRWRASLGAGWRFLGDAWERGYGTLAWRSMVPERMMPWYVLTFDGERTHGYGVRTQAGAICSWRMDPAGVSLWLDVRAGGTGVELGERRLDAATVVAREGQAGETSFTAARALCAMMCPEPLNPAQPVYGGNNWYYAYGRSSHDEILEDAKLIASLAPDSDNRPFMVIDDGWQIAHDSPYNGGPWDKGNERFGDLPGLAAEMKAIGVRPGIWIRPLWTKQDVFRSWQVSAERFGRTMSPPPLDPSVSDVADFVATDMRRLASWGFELIKHDFTTFDICGRWGFEMPVDMTPDGWSFARRDRTTAEVMTDLYRAIRRGASGAMILGCNTVGHLAAGLVELQRTGDDTSGRDWERTRRMGVNTLAFRMPQQGTFFGADADCVGLTNEVPWEHNRQWLDLVARSGTPLFVSASPDAVGPEQRRLLEQAFAIAAKPLPPGEPLDWLETTCPARWKLNGERVDYDWFMPQGMDCGMA